MGHEGLRDHSVGVAQLLLGLGSALAGQLGPGGHRVQRSAHTETVLQHLLGADGLGDTDTGGQDIRLELGLRGVTDVTCGVLAGADQLVGGEYR